MTSGPAFLGELRDRLLDQVLGLLQADTAVDGAALIGSLGRGEADNWSDIDLLILMGDRALARFADEPAASTWAQADLLSDGRHNSPAGAISLGASWPADGRIVFQRRLIETGTSSFDQLNASGSRQPATAKTAAEIQRIHLSYVPIAGKYIGRRSSRAYEMIRFLGTMTDFSSGDPAAQLLALRRIAGELSAPAWTWLSAAVTAYLDLVEASL